MNFVVCPQIISRRLFKNVGIEIVDGDIEQRLMSGMHDRDIHLAIAQDFRQEQKVDCVFDV